MSIDVSMCGRGTGPVFNRRISGAVKSMSMMDVLRGGDWSPTVRRDFCQGYKDWVEACTVAPVTGLGQFDNLYMVNGVTQAYDIFFFAHKGRRFRTYRGEYPYVRLSMDQWQFLEDDELRENDALCVTYPFYGDGAAPRDMAKTLDRCAELGVPVMVDAAYFGTCYDVSLDYSHPAIEMVGFSLSKPFCLQSFRAGVMFSKQQFGFLEEIQVASNYFNKVGASVGLSLMKQFPADFMPSTYRAAHQKQCQDMGLLPSNCIMLANIPDGDNRFDEILADPRFEDNELPEGVLRRICISRYISDGDSGLKSIAKNALAEVRKAKRMLAGVS